MRNLLENDAYAYPNLHGVGLDVDQVRNHVRSFGELDDRYDVWDERLPDRPEGMMHDRIRVDRALPARPRPFVFGGQAARAERAGRVPDRSAPSAPLEEQLAAGAAVPEGLRLWTRTGDGTRARFDHLPPAH